MLTDFDKDLAGIDLSAEGASQLILDAVNKRSDGLSNKNAELLEKLSSNRTDTNGTAAELEALRGFKSSADVKSAEDAESYQAAKLLTQTGHDEAMSKEKNRGDSFETQLKTLLINDGLSAALDGVNINKDLKAGAVAMLQAGATITDGKAMIGDKSLSEAVNDWAKSDAGKAFCLAPDNTGGDGNGGGSGQSGSDKDWSKMSVKERTAYLASKT